MNTKRNIVLPAVLAVAVAVVIIASTIFAGTPIAPTNTNSISSSSSAETSGGQPTSSQVQQSSTGSSMSTSAVTSTTATSSASPPSGQGLLSVLLTDPPNIPPGVTKVYVSYSDLEVHVSDAGNQSGWTQVQSSGQIELLGTVNASQTLSSVKVTSGVYNALRFNITSAEVTYNSKNYTAFVNNAELNVPIVHGIAVNASTPSAAIISISPTVMNIGSSSTPEFIIRSEATAFPVPSGQVTTGMGQPGHKTVIAGLQWWKDIVQNYTANLQVQSATLSSAGLNVTIGNTGTKPTLITLVSVTPLADAIGVHPMGYVPSSIVGGAIFGVDANGTLFPLRVVIPLAASTQSTVSAQIFRDVGMNLTAGSSTTLSYKGSISFGFLSILKSQGSVVAHQQYLVTVVGTQAVASFVVVAT